MSRRPARSAIATLAASVAFTVACSTPAPVAADLVITDASIWTGNPAQAAATALAIIGDRIVDVGDDHAIERWRGADTIVIDAGDAALCPASTTRTCTSSTAAPCSTRSSLKDAATARPNSSVASASGSGRVRASGWSAAHWDNGAGRRRRCRPAQMIDDATNGTPVLVTRFDGRMALANSAALGRAGVTAASPDPPGGAIVRDPATGFRPVS